MKKQSDLSRLMEYAGKYRILAYLSWTLSAMSALLAPVPFWYIWRIIHDIQEAFPGCFPGRKHHQLRLVCRRVCGYLGYRLYSCADVFA